MAKKKTSKKTAGKSKGAASAALLAGGPRPSRAGSANYSSAEMLAATFNPRNIAIMYRPHKPEAQKLARELATWLIEQGFSVFCAPRQSLLNRRTPVVNSRNVSKIDWVIALGGDGTYLRAVGMLGGLQTPILGVNMGNLGFLTETRSEDLYKAVISTLEHKMEFRPRSMLKVEVRRNNKVISTHMALNDAVMERGSNTHLINIAILSQKHHVADIKADALIVASPTGSTAYNLAAGGPILHPDAHAMVVTPVSPHALTSRPLIFPDDQQLSFRVITRDAPAILTVDGVNCGQIRIDDEVVVVRNPTDHYVIRKPSANYFALLREKLKFGQRN